MPSMLITAPAPAHSNLVESTLDLKHYGPAHTNGDISATFAKADIAHVADTFWNGVYPLIDYSTGGVGSHASLGLYSAA